MADVYAALAESPRYCVPVVSKEPVTLAQIRQLSETRQKEVEQQSERVHGCEVAVKNAQIDAAAARTALDSAESQAAAARQALVTARQQQQQSAASVAGIKRRRGDAPTSEVAAAQRIVDAMVTVAAAASANLRAVQARIESASRALTAATQAGHRLSQLASNLCTIAREIGECEEFEASTLEEDFAQGVWTAECFRFRRRRLPSLSMRIPRTDLCSKASPTIKGFTPGLLAMSCPHGYLYVLKLLRRGESPEAVYDFLRDRCRPGYLPSIVCYDNGCNLDSYIAARSPEIAAKLLLVIDRLHARNHTHCSSSYQLDRFVHYDKCRDFNTQIQEQNNRFLQRAAQSVRFSTPRNAIRAFHSLAMVNASFRLRRDAPWGLSCSLQRNPAAVDDDEEASDDVEDDGSD